MGQSMCFIPLGSEEKEEEEEEELKFTSNDVI
jgi:hypothetical protein